MQLPILTLKDLSLAYDQTIWSDVNLTVKEGQSVALIGANGSGKTSLLKCLLGLIPCEGKIFYKDRNLTSFSRGDLAERIAYLPQQAEVFPDLEIIDFLNISKTDLEIDLSEIIDLCGISNFLDRRFATLSGGEQQKVLLVGAILQESELLLLDEPGVFLDPKGKAQLGAILHILKEKYQKTILFVSHDLEFVLENSDYLFALSNNTLTLNAETNSLTRKELEEVYD